MEPGRNRGRALHPAGERRDGGQEFSPPGKTGRPASVFAAYLRDVTPNANARDVTVWNSLGPRVFPCTVRSQSAPDRSGLRSVGEATPGRSVLCNIAPRCVPNGSGESPRGRLPANPYAGHRSGSALCASGSLSKCRLNHSYVWRRI